MYMMKKIFQYDDMIVIVVQIILGGSLCIREFSKNYNSFLDELEAFLSSQQDAYLSSEMLINFEASILKSVSFQINFFSRTYYFNFFND